MTATGGVDAVQSPSSIALIVNLKGWLFRLSSISEILSYSFSLETELRFDISLEMVCNQMEYCSWISVASKIRRLALNVLWHHIRERAIHEYRQWKMDRMLYAVTFLAHRSVFMARYRDRYCIRTADDEAALKDVR